MIGFVAAITASLAVIILVVISSLIGFVQSIMPTDGIVKIDTLTYRYYLKTPYVTHETLKELVITVSDMKFSSRIKSYQTGCNYGFNANREEMTRIATYNYIATNQFFGGSYPIDHINIESQTKKMNNCFVDIHLYEKEDTQNNQAQKPDSLTGNSGENSSGENNE